jgi:hypothetical protein
MESKTDDDPEAVLLHCLEKTFLPGSATLANRPRLERSASLATAAILALPRHPFARLPALRMHDDFNHIHNRSGPLVKDDRPVANHATRVICGQRR